MATPTKSIEYSGFTRPLRFRLGVLNIRKSIILMIIFIVFIFLSAFYYVEQQVRLQTLNYTIIELKKRKKELLKDQKTAQLKLHQLKRLDRIEQNMKQRGFVPVEKEQIRIVQ
jgi:hypothetical protein